MEPQQKELSLDESVKQVMKTLPPFIQAYLKQGKYTTVAQGLMSKYKLRIDQGGVLERELLLLLMGIEDPTEFTKALIDEANIVDRMTVNSIVKDINEQVFMPLRKQEEELSKGAVPEKPKPAASQAASRPAIAEQRTIAPAPHIAPLPPKMAMPAPAGTLSDVLRSVMAPKPLDNSKLLSDHEEPHMDMPTPSAAPAVPQAEPNVPSAAEPVQKKADAIPAVESPIMPLVKKTPPPLIQEPKVPPPPPITSYSADPYREPIDEQ